MPTLRSKRRHLATNSAAWIKMRAAHLQREPLCRHCFASGIITACVGVGLRGQVDHIDGNDANNDTSNFQTLCLTCHGLKTALQSGHKPKLRAW